MTSTDSQTDSQTDSLTFLQPSNKDDIYCFRRLNDDVVPDVGNCLHFLVGTSDIKSRKII